MRLMREQRFGRVGQLVAQRAMGFGIDVMDTGAACRTYNVLIGEERRVAAALLPVD